MQARNPARHLVNHDIRTRLLLLRGTSWLLLGWLVTAGSARLTLVHLHVVISALLTLFLLIVFRVLDVDLLAAGLGLSVVVSGDDGVASAKLSSVSDLRSAFAGRGLGGTAHENDEVRLRGASGGEKVIYGRGGKAKGGNGAGALRRPRFIWVLRGSRAVSLLSHPPIPGPMSHPRAWQCACPVPGSLGQAASATLSPSSGSGSGSRQGRCVSRADITVSVIVSAYRDSDSAFPRPRAAAAAAASQPG